MKNLVDESLDLNREKRIKEFEVLLFPLMGRLYNTAFRMTKKPLDAEDLVQKTYMKAWRYFHKFEPGTDFHGWIYRILINNFINEYRRKKLEPARRDFETTCKIVPGEDTNELDWNRGFNFEENCEALFDDQITAALDRLPEKYRIVVLLCDVNDLKYKEIAEILDCPAGTVMSRLSRGRQMLARYLKKYAQTNGYVNVCAIG